MPNEQHDISRQPVERGTFTVKITVDVDGVERQFFANGILDHHSDPYAVARATLGALAAGADAWIDAQGKIAQIPPADPAPTPRTDWGKRRNPPTPRKRGQ